MAQFLAKWLTPMFPQTYTNFEGDQSKWKIKKETLTRSTNTHTQAHNGKAKKRRPTD